mgnify:CR=1 FL=1
MPKQIYNWSKVKAGDIISFRYKGNNPTATLATVLVLNPRLPYTKKDNTKNFHLVGLKIERWGTIPIIRSKQALAQLLNEVGDIKVVDSDSKIYRVEIQGVGPRGVKRNVYTKLKRYIKRYSVYRTYDYREAKKSAVFLEPIILPKPLVEALIEN